jgi:ABC-type amino acid transport substrate-binding protein
MSKLTTVAALTAGLACAATAGASPLLDNSAYGVLVGASAATVNGVAFTASGGTFATKFVNGWGGLGVSGGPSGSEIDIGQSIAMDFAARVIADFSVALLYNGPEFGDYREIAQMLAYNGQVLIGSFTLEVDSDNTVPGASWSGPGVVSNLSTPTTATGGAWRVSGHPFGEGAVTRLVFGALASGDCQSQCNNQSDYVLSAVHAVPEPATGALVALGLGAAAFAPRRRSRA